MLSPNGLAEQQISFRSGRDRDCARSGNARVAVTLVMITDVMTPVGGGARRTFGDDVHRPCTPNERVYDSRK